MRTIKIAEGALNKIMGNEYEVSSFDRFINMENTIKSSDDSKSLLSVYRLKYEDVKSKLDYMSVLEDLIILHRIYQNPEIVLSTQREYVYARQACPKDNKKSNDIRICIGLKEQYDEDFLNDKKLMEKAIYEIRRRLSKDIHDKQNQLEMLTPAASVQKMLTTKKKKSVSLTK